VTPKRICVLSASLAFALAPPAVADPLALATSGDLPFTRAELEAALAVRVGLAEAGASRRIDAQVTGDARHVQIAVAGRARSVALAGERGADAARLVAFSILDVAGDQLDPPAGPRDEIPLEPSPAPALKQDTGPWTLALWGSVGSDAAGTLELAAPLAGRVRLVGAAGVGLATSERAMAREVSLRAFPARLWLAMRVWHVELRAGAVGVLQQASAARSSLDTLAGASAGVVFVEPLAHGFSLLAGGGGDAFANALDYRVDGMHVTTTDRFGWWAGAGIAREVRW
jgi:hypothetical protein